MDGRLSRRRAAGIWLLRWNNNRPRVSEVLLECYSFSADALHNSLRSIEGLRHLGEQLESLTIGRTKVQLDLKVVGRFKNLTRLIVERQSKGLEVIGTMASLEELTLRSITLPDLSLSYRRSLRALALKLGGTREIGLLRELPQLEYLELWMIKGFDDASAVGDIETLRYLFLQSLARVTSLPSLESSRHLRRVHIETMKGLRDLASVAMAPALESLLVIDCSQFSAEHFAPFVGHPSLREARIGTGSSRRNMAIDELLRLPSAEAARWRDVCSG